MERETESVRILYLDSRECADQVAQELEDADGRFTVEVARSVTAGVDRLESAAFDCLVATGPLDGRDGVELLSAISAAVQDIPFVLYDVDGADIASGATFVGGTDSPLDTDESDPVDRLAARIDAVLSEHRAAQRDERRVTIFENAQRIADIGAWEYGIQTDRTFVTEGVRRLHGLEPDEELTPERSIEHYHPDDRSTIRAAFQQAIEAGEPYDLELRFRTADGDQRWIRTRGCPQTEDGEPVRILGTMHDITDLKRRERELQQQKERLEEFAHVVSHDIRTPLQLASGLLDEAERTGDEETFERIRQAHQQIETLIENVLALAKQGVQIGETEPVEIGEIVRDASKSLDEGGITVETAGTFRIEADPNRLRQLFENLLANASEHAGPDTTVTVGLIDPLPTSTRDSDDGGRGFYIADNGPGIPEDERSDVFDAGYSTAVDGTGFGLSIVKEVALAHGWDISVTAGRDGGARFEITGVEIVSP